MKDLTWSRLADGRVWRLKQGKHFAAEPRAFLVEVHAAAARMGKAVRAWPAEFGKRRRTYNYLWIQFADQELPLGSQCACGGTAMVRTHEFFGVCSACGSSLIFVVPRSELSPEQLALAEQDAAALAEAEAATSNGADPGAGPAIRPATDTSGRDTTATAVGAPARAVAAGKPLGGTRSEDSDQLPRTKRNRRPEVRRKKARLDRYSRVQLKCYEKSKDRERWAGEGLDSKGRRVALGVDYPLDENGNRLEDPARPGESVYALSVVRLPSSSRRS